jgi:hypothetical protein
MRPLVRTAFSAVTILLLLWSAPVAHAESPGLSLDRESLRGLAGLEVLAEPLNIEIEDRGLTASALQQDVKQRLQKAGVKVLTERERLNSPAAALLIIRVDALHDRIGRYFYSINLLLTQRVRLAGHDGSDLSAVTWMKPGGLGIVADDNVKHLRDQVLRAVDAFVKDYLAVNPDRRTNH